MNDSSHSMTQSAARLIVVCGVLLMAHPASALVISETFRYDGSYDPYSATPPAGQSSWSALGGALAPTPNSPSPGLAAFVDNSAAARLTMARAHQDAAFIANPAAYQWQSDFRLRLNSAASPNTFFGVRDEGGNGKMALVSYSGTSLEYEGLGGSAFYTYGVTGPSLADGQLHDVQVVKREVNGVMYVQAIVDGVLRNTRTYNSMPDDVAGSNGFGYFSSTPGLSNTVIDEVTLAAPSLSGFVVANYDGTYQPNATPPTSTTTTWNVLTTGGLTIAANSPAGSATLNDNNSGGRIQINTPLPVTMQHELWSFESRLQLSNQPGAFASNPILLGMRGEGGGGREVMLGWDTSTGALGFYEDISTTPFQLITSDNLFDGAFHTYRVEKRRDALGDLTIQVYLDGLAQFVNPLSYTLFPIDDLSGEGFGLFGSTPGLSHITLDSMRLQVDLLQASAVPEPTTGVLALVGLAALGLTFRCRRRGVSAS